MTVRILLGDALSRLRELPDESVHMCVTSPPYYGLRSYIPDSHDLKRFELGLEPTLDEYIENMVAVFREVRRVLRSDGTLWLNIGDSYATGAGAVGNCPGGGTQGAKWAGAKTSPNRMPQAGYKPKDLMGVPWRLAFALQADGWYLRSEIIWAKKSCMPESVRDRPTKSHEQIFLLAKSESYFYDQAAASEPVTQSTIDRCSQESWDEQAGSERVPGKTNGPMKAVVKRSGNKERKPASARGVPVDTDGSTNGAVAGSIPWEGSTRNWRDVWSLGPEPFKMTAPDFAGADYVDERGIPRKRSPNCPVHGPSSSPRQEIRGGGACGGQQGTSLSRTSHSDGDLVQEPLGEPAQIARCRTSVPSGTPSSESAESTLPSRTAGQIGETEPQNSPHSQCTQSPCATTLDSSLHEGSQIATSSSNGIRRTGHEPLTSPRDMPSAETSSGIGRSELQSASRHLGGRIFESSSAAPLFPEHGPEPDIAPSPSGNGSNEIEIASLAKCVCRPSMLSHFATFPTEIPRRAIVAGCPVGGTVLDPFLGSGTTALVADQLQRDCIGIELNPAYADMAERRIRAASPLFADIARDRGEWRRSEGAA